MPPTDDVSHLRTTQLALDHFDIGRIVFSGIAGGVDHLRPAGGSGVGDKAWPRP